MPAEISFNFTPEEALEYFRRREEKKVSWSYKDVWQEEHKRAFTVAKLTKASLLNDVQQSLDKALAEGKSFEQWRSEILQKLDKVWLGRTYGELWDEMSPEEQEKHEEPTEDERNRVISDSRLTTIFRTNMFSSYQAGRYRQLVEDVEDYPYWRYVTMEDEAVRPLHAALHGKVFRWDDPFWDTHYPPNGFNCRCEVEGLDDFDLEAQGLTLEEGEMFTIKEPDGTERAAYRDADGKTYPCDKGWSYNVGKEDGLRRVIENKDLPEQLRLQLDWDLQQYEPPKAAADEVKATPKKTKAKTAPKAAEPETVKTAAQPSVKPAAETPPSDAKPKKSRKPKADKLQEQEQAILRDMERQNKELEKLYQHFDPSVPELPEEPALEAVKAEPAPAAADVQVVKQAEKEVKPLRAADTNSKKEAKKAKRLKKKQASEAVRRADEAPKKVKITKSDAQAVEIELRPVKEEGASVYHDTPIPAKGNGVKIEDNKLLTDKKIKELLQQDIQNFERANRHVEAYKFFSTVTKNIKQDTYQVCIQKAEIKADEKINYRFCDLCDDSILIDFTNIEKFELVEFEHLIKEKEIEYCVVLDKYGQPIFGGIGQRSEINITQLVEKYIEKHGLTKSQLINIIEGGTVVHNHPDYFAPLSADDLSTVFDYKLQTVIAVSKEGKYYFRLKSKYMNNNDFKDTIVSLPDAALLEAAKDERYVSSASCREDLNINASLINERLEKSLYDYGTYYCKTWV